MGQNATTTDIVDRLVDELGQLSQRFTHLAVATPHLELYDRMNRREAIPPGELERVVNLGGSHVADAIRVANATGMTIVGVDDGIGSRDERVVESGRRVQQLLDEGATPIYLGSSRYVLSTNYRGMPSVPDEIDLLIDKRTFLQTGGFIERAERYRDSEYYEEVWRAGATNEYFTNRDDVELQEIVCHHAPEVPIDDLPAEMMRSGTEPVDDEIAEIIDRYHDRADPDHADGIRSLLADERAVRLGDIARMASASDCEIVGRVAMADGDFAVAAKCFGRGRQLGGEHLWRSEARALAADGDIDRASLVLVGAVRGGHSGAVRLYQALAKATGRSNEIVEALGAVAAVEERCDIEQRDRTRKHVALPDDQRIAFDELVEAVSRERALQVQAEPTVEIGTHDRSSHPASPEPGQTASNEHAAPSDETVGPRQRRSRVPRLDPVGTARPPRPTLDRRRDAPSVVASDGELGEPQSAILDEVGQDSELHTGSTTTTDRESPDASAAIDLG